MAQRHIIAVGFQLPFDAGIKWVDFRSDQSLLDADIVLFKPDMRPYLDQASDEWAAQELDEAWSWAFAEESDRWHEELATAFDHGKTVIVFLARHQDLHLDLQKAEQSSNYRFLPFTVGDCGLGSGQKMRLTGRLPAIAPYWKEFSEFSKYEMFINWPNLEPLVVTAKGDRVVGGFARVGNGQLLALPPITIPQLPPNMANFSEISTWHRQKGQRFVDLIVGLDRSLQVEAGLTPPPAWTVEVELRTVAEQRLVDEQERISVQIELLRAEQEMVTARLNEEARLRDLLFETGKPLERAIVTALRLLGFQAEPYQDAESEFDAVFTSPEGRFLGEAEGKDNKAVNIDKLDQLNRNIGEDFARDDIEEYAKGILFGNAFRLEPLDKRGEFFTSKCMTGADRSKAALVRTPDLFAVARYLRDHDDPDFARACREAIANTDGAIVVFPPPPPAPTA